MQLDILDKKCLFGNCKTNLFWGGGVVHELNKIKLIPLLIVY